MDMTVFEDTHILSQSELDIKLICKPVFEKLNLAYFSYGRFYDDGKCILLCTNKNVFHNHFKKGYKLTVQPDEKDAQKTEFYNLIFVNNDSPDIIADEYNHFNHGTMIDHIKRHPGYYEMFCYVSGDISIQPANHFLNSLDAIHDFSAEFLEKSSKIMEVAQHQIIQLPSSMLPEINGKIDNHDKGNTIIVGDKKILLSERQFQCLALISIGKSSKEIAKYLNLSYRTIETHIEIIKHKLNCKRRSDLLFMASKNKLNQHAISLLKQSNNN